MKSLRNLTLLTNLSQDNLAVWQLATKWVERSPNDPEARFVRFNYEINWHNNGYQTALKPDVAGIKEQYAWFAAHRPDLLTWMTSNYVQFLRNNGERPERASS